MKELDISFDDISAEIERLSIQNPGGFTVAEMSDATGHGPDWCRAKLKKMIDSGLAAYNGRASRKAIDGINRLVPVYVTKKKSKK